MEFIRVLFRSRMLALTIDRQNILFTRFEDLLTARIEGAIASGTYELGLETLQAESFKIVDRATIYTHPGTRAETRLLTIERKDRNRPVTLDEAFGHLRDRRARLLVNAQSGRAAVQVPTRGLQLDDGRSEEHTSELQSLMRISYAVFCLKTKNHNHRTTTTSALK